MGVEQAAHLGQGWLMASRDVPVLLSHSGCASLWVSVSHHRRMMGEIVV